MAQLTIQAIVSNQVLNKKGDKNYLSIVDIETGETIKIGVPAALDVSLLRVPLALTFQGFAAKRGDNGAYFVAESVTASNPAKAGGKS